MAKRFTDAGKWRRPWFRKLSKEAKLAWGYLCDECDHTGVWIADFDLMSFQLDFKIDEAKLIEWLGDKLVRLDSDKFFIPSYFEFQYGDADEGFKAKQSAIKKLRGFGLIDESTNSLKDLSNSYLRLQGQSPDCHIIIKSKSNINSGGVQRGEIEAAVYKPYPRKEGKSDGIARLARDLSLGASLADMAKACERFCAHHKALGTEKQYLPHFSTWTSTWRDCLEPTYGQSEDFSRPEGALSEAEYAAREAAIFQEASGD
jgi:hypothetical protein